MSEDTTSHDMAGVGGAASAAGRGLLSEAPKLTPIWALRAVYCIGIGSGACLWKFLPVFYQRIGLSNTQIGVIQMCSPCITFVAQIMWATICDKLQSYKEVLAGTTLVGVSILCCALIPYVQQHFSLLCFSVLLGAFFMASRGSLNDSMTLQVVEDYAEARRVAEVSGQELGRSLTVPSYGEQRLWGAFGWGCGSILGGLLLDHFGVTFMFCAFTVLLFATVGIIILFFPGRAKRRLPPEGTAITKFHSFQVLWFFANLVIYGICMSLVESFLFVYLQEDFQGATSLLCGASVTVMCAFEIPVFAKFKNLVAHLSLTATLSACHYIMLFRLVAYSLLPERMPYLVLLIEPLHGITFALMWSCSVEYGRRVAPAGAEARMQAFVNGLYCQFSIGVGSLLWGRLSEEPSQGGLGFRRCFLVAGVVLVLWSWVWNLGWCLYRRKWQHEAPLLTEARGEVS